MKPYKNRGKESQALPRAGVAVAGLPPDPQQMPDAPETVPQDRDSAALVRRAQTGDETAFSEIVTLYERFVFHTAVRVLRMSGGNPDDGEDVAQNVFLKAWRSLDSFRGDCAVSTWLYRITVNAARDQVRVAMRHETLSLTAAEDDGGGWDDLEAPAREKIGDGKRRRSRRRGGRGNAPRPAQEKPGKPVPQQVAKPDAPKAQDKPKGPKPPKAEGEPPKSGGSRRRGRGPRPEGTKPQDTAPKAPKPQGEPKPAPQQSAAPRPEKAEGGEGQRRRRSRGGRRRSGGSKTGGTSNSEA